MANGKTDNRRNIAIGIVAAIVVLLLILWLGGVFEATTDEPLTPETETEMTPDPDAAQPETEEPQQE